MTCAYTIWAQSFGQRGVTAARANLVYTSQPVFSALFAFGLLHEVPTAATLAGGGLILIAVAAEVLAMDEAPARTAPVTIDQDSSHFSARRSPPPPSSVSIVAWTS